jgi:hypothetical protein
LLENKFLIRQLCRSANNMLIFSIFCSYLSSGGARSIE